MPEAKKCNYVYQGNEDHAYRCTRNAVENGDKCIFHGEEKDSDEFRTAFQRITGEDEGLYTGFVFPEEVTDLLFKSRGQALTKDSPEDEKTTFLRNMTFIDTTFGKGFILSNTVFEGSVNMAECRMHGECSFSGSTFKKKLTLNNATVHDRMDLTETSFSTEGFSYKSKPPVRPREGKGVVFFRTVEYSNPETIVFLFVDLWRWSFLYTDVSKIDFRGCLWYVPPRTGPKGRLSAERILFDEIEQNWNYRPLMWCLKGKNRDEIRKKSSADFAGISLLYKELRMNFEQRLHHHEAGDFHIGEMEARRLALWNNKSLKRFNRVSAYIVLCLYKAISGYGERYLRTGLIFLGFTLLFGVFYLFAGINETGINGATVAEPLTISQVWHLISGVPRIEFVSIIGKRFWYTVAYSFEVATLFIRDKHYIYNEKWGWFLFMLESLFGAVTIPLFVLALRRSFKRWRADS